MFIHLTKCYEEIIDEIIFFNIFFNIEQTFLNRLFLNYI